MCDLFRLSRKKVILRKKGLNPTKTEVVYGIIIMGVKEKVNERIILGNSSRSDSIFVF